MQDKNNLNIRATTMELNRLSVSVISVLITLAICFGGFAYKTGQTQNELQNLKEQNITTKDDFTKQVSTLKIDFNDRSSTLKEDFNKQIDRLEDTKAEKDIVELILKKIDDNNTLNKEEHRLLMEKMDSVITNIVSKGK